MSNYEPTVEEVIGVLSKFPKDSHVKLPDGLRIRARRDECESIETGKVTDNLECKRVENTVPVNETIQSNCDIDEEDGYLKITHWIPPVAYPNDNEYAFITTMPEYLKDHIARERFNNATIANILTDMYHAQVSTLLEYITQASTHRADAIMCTIVNNDK